MSDWATLIKALAALLWPILGFVVVFLFKVQIREMFQRLIKGKFFGQELELASNFNATQQTQVRDTSEDISKSVGTKVENLLPDNLPDYFKLQLDAIRTELRKRALDSPTERELILYALTNSQTLQHFERLARIIFGSQLNLLVNANSMANGVPIEFAREAYNTAVRNFFDAYKGIDFNRWLGFLVSNGLVANNGNQIVVTSKGKDFMKFLVDNNDTGARAL